LDPKTLEPVPRDERHKAPLTRWNHAVIKAVDARDIAVVGEKGSLIDGRDAYDPRGEEGYRGPHAIDLFYCQNVTFRGYTIKNSANWAHCIFFSDNVQAKDLTVLGGHDGFHVRGCRNVTVEDSVFHTGDDSIAGFANLNVHVRNCSLNSACSHFRFGGTNVLIESCRAFGPGIYGHRYTMSREEQAASLPTNETHRHNTLAFFTYFATNEISTPFEPGNILIRDTSVENVDRFFQFNFSGSDKWQTGQSLRNIAFEDMRIEGVRMPTVIYSTPAVKTAVEMRNVTYALDESVPAFDPIHAANFDRLSFRGVTFRGVRTDFLIRAWDDGGEIVSDGLTVENPVKALRVRADFPFFSADI
ncbi:MAG: right-handed parallel beta-helix repeat-containing protein, partial [Clostridia bacterium]|nr:right-handed parallel beta-helix repeat-containing protein [Clostridia bacterium]